MVRDRRPEPGNSPQCDLVQAIQSLLDRLEPARLRPEDQSVGPDQQGQTWVKLRHDSEPEIIIDILLSDGWVNFYGVMGHDEA